MRTLRPASIKQKLTLIAILPSTLALLIVGLVFFAFDEITLKKAMVQEITMLSQVIGANNSAALLFNDQKSAVDNLAVLSVNPHVISGCIYTAAGDVFAGYTRKNIQPPPVYPPLRGEGCFFSDNHLSIFKQIRLNNNTIGTVHLEYDLEALHSRRTGYATIAVILVLFGSGLVFAMSSWLRKAISDPLLDLAETAKSISQEKDYSIRAHGEGSSEIGILISGFNEMLEQVQERDARLDRYREELEQQVSIRTAELKTSNDTLKIQIEENARIEEELFRTRQLESLGILAGGIAHDFNNLLAAILMSTGLAKKYSPPDGKAYARLETIENACDRARDLTQQLLTFSKGGAPVTKVTSIADLIGDSARFVLRGSKSRCSFVICDDLWPVEVDEGQISQVIYNLAINADQAMPDGGTVLISTENVVVDSNSRVKLAPGRYVKISVKDSGIGISKEQMTKIFTPYFTTKASGSGLGLATSYSIVNKHNGLITVESEPGAGTTFHVYLPASLSELPEDQSPVEPEISGSGRILVMDDDEFVREATGETLTNAGYQVGYAPGGAEALAMYQAARQSGEPYDLVIMDLTIPGGMGGVEAIKKLLETDPDAKAVAASGYAQGSILSDFKSYGFRGVLAKPFSVNDLCTLVHHVILYGE
jgi:signal transduction histidine kinase/ActR/RegA family two-component response regulator